MEVAFYFRPLNNAYDDAKVIELRKEYDFNSKNGLDEIIFALDMDEVEEYSRFMFKIERSLKFDLSKLDFWNDAHYEKYQNLPDFVAFLKALEKMILEAPDFWEYVIHWDTRIDYLKNQFLSDIRYLIQLCELHASQFGSTEIMIESD